MKNLVFHINPSKLNLKNEKELSLIKYQIEYRLLMENLFFTNNSNKNS